MNFKVSQLKSLTAGQVAVDDLIYVIDSNPTDGSVKSKKVTVGDLIDSRIYGISSSQFVLITGYYANPSWISSLDWSKITNAPSFVTSLSALTDVQLSTPLVGQALVYNGSKWVNQGIGELDTLNSVTTRGNTTTNSITVGGLTISNGSASITKTTSGATLTLTPNASDNAIVINNNGFIKFTSGADSFIRGSSSTFVILDASYVSKVQFHWGGNASWINTGGNLLIGTTTDAGYKLDVNGTIRTTGTSTNGVIFYDGTYGAKISMSSYIFTIEKEGTYGISTYLFKYNDGTAALSLTGNTTILGIGGSDDAVMLSRNVYARHDAAFGFTTYASTTKYKAIQAIFTDNSTSGVAFNYKTGGTDTEAMRITSAGNVGIGTVSPTEKLSISGGNMTMESGRFIKFNYSTPFWIGADGTANGFTIFDATASLRRFTITTTGNVLINTTTDAGYKLDVNGSVRAVNDITTNGTFVATSTSLSGSVKYFNLVRSTDGNNPFYVTSDKVNMYGVLFQLSSQGGGTISSGNSVGGASTYITMSGPAYYSSTSGVAGTFAVAGQSNMSSGTATFNTLTVSPTINNSGTYSGIFRGFYYNPTLTSLTGTTHRAIETTSGDVIFNGGNVGIGTSSPTSKLYLDGGLFTKKYYTDTASNTINFGSAYELFGTLHASSGYSFFINPSGWSAGWNVKIGNTTTSFDFDYSSGFSAPRINTELLNLGGGMVSYYKSSPDTGFAYSSAGGWDFVIRGTSDEKLRIKAGGNVLIGTTTDAGFKLDVNGTARVQGNATVTGTASSFSLDASNRRGVVIGSASSLGSVELRGDTLYSGFLTFSRNTTGEANFGINYVSGASALKISNTLTSPFYITTPSTTVFDGSITASSSLARGLLVSNTLVAAANNDVLVGLDINPTFTNGAFTGVSNFALRVAYVASRYISFTQRPGYADYGRIQFTNVTGGDIYSSSKIDLIPNDTDQSVGLGNGLTSRRLASSTNYGLYGPTPPGFLVIGNSAFVVLSANADVNTDSFVFSGPTGSRHFFKVVQNNVPYFTIMPTGNVLVNTTTDAGYKLDVNGTARFQGFTTVSATTLVNGDAALTIQSTTNNSVVGQLYGINNIVTASTNVSNISGINSAVNTSSSASLMAAVQGQVNISANTVTEAKGFTTNPAATGTGTFTRYIGFDNLAVFTAGSGSVGSQIFLRSQYLNAAANNIGLLLQDAAAATVTGNWAIHDQTGYGSYFKGSIGIGTTTLTRQLNISGTNPVALLNATSVSYAGVNLKSTAGNFYVALDGSTPSFGTANASVFWSEINAPMIFAVLNVERVRIHANGNFAIGTTTDAGYKLQVQGSGYFNTNTASTNSILKLTDNTNGTAWLGISSAVTTGFFIGSNGTMTLGKITGGDNSSPSTSYSTITLNQNGVSSIQLATNVANTGIVFSDGVNGTIRMNFPAVSEAAITTISTHNLSIGVASSTGSLSSTTMKFFQSTNNVAIGTTTDAGYKLDVNGSVRIVSSLRTDTFGTDNNATIGGTLALNSSIIVLNKAQTTYIPLATRNTTGSEVVYDLSNIGSISATGNVGIGTSTPFGKVDVKDGEIFVTTSTNANLRSRLTYQGLYVSRSSDGTYPEQITSASSAWEYHSRNSHVFYRDTLPYFAMGTLFVGSFINVNTTGNVLINTSTDAGYKLDVNGSARVGSLGLYGNNGTITAPLIKFNGSNKVNVDPQGYGTVTNDSLITGNYILASGGGIRANGGFGAKSSTSVVSTPFISYGISRPDSDASVNALAGMGGVHDGATNWFQGLGLVFYTSNGPDISGGSYLTEKMRLSSVGNLGIGTTSPSYKTQISQAGGSSTAISTIASTNYNLVVQNTTDLAGTYTGIGFMNPYDTQGYIGVAQVGTGYGAGGNMLFALRPAGGGTVMTEYMRLTSGGNLLLGTTTDSARLTVKGSGSTSATSSLLVQNSGGTESFKIQDDNIVRTTYLGVGGGTSTNNIGGTTIAQFGNAVSSGDQLIVVDSVAGTKRGFKFGNQGTIRMALIQDGVNLQIGNFVSTFNPYVTFEYVTGNVGFGTASTNSSAKVQIDSTTQGFLAPRMTTAQINAITTPAEGLQVYNTDLHVICFYDGTDWKKVSHSNM